MKKSYQSLEEKSPNKMMPAGYRKLTIKTLLSGLLFSLVISTSVYAQEGDPDKGKTLFNTNCAACHQLDKKMTGPALRFVEQRLADDEGLDRDWIAAWIRNSPAVISSGDAYANKIYAEYNNCLLYTSDAADD